MRATAPGKAPASGGQRHGETNRPAGRRGKTPPEGAGRGRGMGRPVGGGVGGPRPPCRTPLACGGAEQCQEDRDVATPPLVVAVANEKGGAGKTSTCVNLAYALAQRGLRVGLVDTDVQCNLTTALGDHLLPEAGEDLGAALKRGDLDDAAWLDRITI